MKQRKSKISWYKQKQLINYFVSGTTARCAGELVGIHRNSAVLYFRRLREIIAYELEQEADDYFFGEIEVDESYFGGVRKGKRGRGAAGEVLGVSLGYFITIPGQRQGVNFIKANNRTFHPYDNGESICKIHTDNDQQEINGLMMKCPPHFQSEENKHPSDEIVYCISGEMVYEVNDTEYHMRAGDVIYVPGNTPHKWSNPTDTECICLWVAGITAQTFIPPS